MSEDLDNQLSWTEGKWSIDGTQDFSSQAPQNDIDEDVESENTSVADENQVFAITSENLPFSKMKQLMTIVSWNPWDITIQVLWNEMKVSEKWLNELKKLIQE
jgi:hypothetical protein